MMRVNSAAGTEEVLRRPGMETVACQRIFALQQLDPARLRHDNDRPAHPAVRAVAAADRIEAVAQRRLETHGAAVALARPDFPVARHDVCFLFELTRGGGGKFVIVRQPGNMGLRISALPCRQIGMPENVFPFSALAWRKKPRRRPISISGNLAQ
jgi:hypothetical protein